MNFDTKWASTFSNLVCGRTELLVKLCKALLDQALVNTVNWNSLYCNYVSNKVSMDKSKPTTKEILSRVISFMHRHD